MAAGDVPLALKEDNQEDKPYVVIATPKGRKSTYIYVGAGAPDSGSFRRIRNMT